MAEPNRNRGTGRAARATPVPVKVFIDDMPRDLRLFLHEYANHMSMVQIDMVASELRAGRSIRIMLGNKLYNLRPG